MEYNHKEIESRWQRFWKDNKVYHTDIDPERPKFYVLDMFPYPSGAGLHVGHPLGYIASDIFARYKRLNGFNVLHPMGYDAYGLPAEQYAIQTGQHPEKPPRRISHATTRSSTASVSATTGIARSAHATPAITTGRSGPSPRCSTTTTTRPPTRRSPLPTW